MGSVCGVELAVLFPTPPECLTRIKFSGTQKRAEKSWEVHGNSANEKCEWVVCQRWRSPSMAGH